MSDKNDEINPLDYYKMLVFLQNEYARRQYFRKALPIVLAIAVALVCFYSYQEHYHGEETIFWTVGIIAAFALLMLYPRNTGWLFGSTLYYEINGSRDKQGNHRCINCGGRGIYRSGEYKSDDVYCYCSKCNFGLWQERK